MKQFVLFVTGFLFFLVQLKMAYGQHSESLNSDFLKSQPGGEIPQHSERKELIYNGEQQNPQLSPADYCAASGGCSEYISRVQFGTMDNTTGCSNYADHTGITPTVFLPWDQTMTVTVTNGAPYSGDQCGIWVDWNNDGDFSDAGETLTVSGTPGNGPYTALINPPDGSTGDRIMRIRITWTGTVSPCGTTTYGEVEDYRIYVASPGVNYWTGRISNSWHTAGNWSLNTVPTWTTDVSITSLNGRDPVISTSTAVCKNLFIGVDHTLTQNSEWIYISGDLSALFGNLLMGDDASILFNGGTDQYWWIGQFSHYTNIMVIKPNTSRLIVSSNGDAIHKQLIVSGGIFELMENSTLGVGSGISSDAVIVQSFVSPVVDGTLKLNPNSSLTITGNLKCQAKSNLMMNNGIIICRGDFIFNNDAGYNIDLSGGKFYFHGTKEIQNLTQTAAASLTFGNVVIEKSYSTSKLYLSNKNMKIAGYLNILNGVLSCANGPSHTAWYNINISGDWTNYNFPYGFEPGNGRVVFDGAGYQYINSSENFNILAANMGATLRMFNEGTSVTCNTYDYTSGGIEVHAGTFTALDLEDNALLGYYRVLPGAIMNLHQDDAQWIDMDGTMVFSGGGTINVFGGNGDSWWAFSNDAILSMNGGTLDFKDVGIIINNTGYGLNMNLTNEATIKTQGGFYAYRSGFNLTGGTVELYGLDDKAIYLNPGNSLYSLKINKAVDGGSIDDYGVSLPDRRSAHIPSPNTRSNSIFLYSDVSITGRVEIPSGNLNLNGYMMNVAGSFLVYGTLSMNNPSDLLNLPGEGNFLRFFSGSTANITAGEINTNGWVMSELGSNFNLSSFNTINLSGSFWSGGLTNREPSATYGNIRVSKNPGIWSYIDGGSTNPIIVTGDFTIDPENTFSMQNQSLIIQGTFSDASTSVLHVNEGAKGSLMVSTDSAVNGAGNYSRDMNTLEIFTPVTLNGVLNVSDRNALIHGLFNSQPGSSIIISGGSLIADATLPDDEHVIAGNLTLTDGLFEVSHSNLTMSSMPKNISGGTIRTAGNFTATDVNVFQPSGGTLEMVPNDFYSYLRCFNGNFLHDLKIDGSSVWIQDQPLHIKDDFFITENGYYWLVSDIYIGGDWYASGNNAYADDQTTYFNGNADQQVIAYLLGLGNVVNAKTGGNLIFDSYQIGIAHDFQADNQNVVKAWFFNVGGLLDLSTGSLTVPDEWLYTITVENFQMGGNLSMQGGLFTANDLVNDGIFGSITIDGPNAVCNLNQDFSQYTDLNGNITIHSGKLNISGGSDISYWPYFGSGSLIMDGGTLDFNGPGILINTTGDFYNLISGGTIRTSGSFIVDRADYVPWGGTTELYSDVTSYVNTMGGGNLHHLTINKAPVEEFHPLSYKDRNGKNVSMVRGGMVEMNASLNVAGMLNIQEGTLKTGYPGITLTCGTNYGGASVLIEEGGSLELGPMTTLKLDLGLSVLEGGEFISGGSPENHVLVAKASDYNYFFNVSNYGSFGADHTIFEYMDHSGLVFQTDSYIEPDHAFNNCIFRNGKAGGTYLFVNTQQDLVSTGAEFDANTTGMASNVSKNFDAGYLTFVSHTGPFSGAAFENDPFDRVEWYGSMPVQSISLPAGWSGLSSYIMPDETDLPTLFSPVGANLSILQTLSGVYYPSGGINTLGSWLSQSAYLIKMNAAATLPFGGLPEHNKTINMNTGWNLIPVICNAEVNTSSLFSGLGADLQIVKEAAGSKIYWPAYGITTLEQLTPGRSYFVRMATPGSITFPNNTDAGMVSPFEPEKDPVQPWNQVTRTPSSHVIGISAGAMQSLEVNDVIGVFTPDGLCVGVISVENRDVNTSIIAFADDALTAEKDGFVAGEAMIFKGYRPSSGEEWTLTAIFEKELPNHDGTFAQEGISMIRQLSGSSVGINEDLNIQVSVYPNPTTGKVTIHTSAGMRNIQIIDPLGNVILKLNLNNETHFTFDLENYPSGVYQVRITALNGTMVRQVVKLQ